MKENFKNSIFNLFALSLFLGTEIGCLSKRLEANELIMPVAPLLSFENLIIWLCFFGLFVYFSFKARSVRLKIAYALGGISFLFTESVINKIGYKFLYGAKILLLLVAIVLLLKYLSSISTLLTETTEENLSDNKSAAPGETEPRH